MDTDNSMVVTRGKGGGKEVEKSKGDQIYGDRIRFDFGWWTQCNIHMMFLIIPKTYIIVFTNITQINLIFFLKKAD